MFSWLCVEPDDPTFIPERHRDFHRGLLLCADVLFSVVTRIRCVFAAPQWLQRLSLAQRKALALTLISLIGWSVWNGFRTFDHPWGDLSRGEFTDHFSHMNAARLFPVVGIDLWRVPIAQQFRRLAPGELAQLPPDLRAGASVTGGIYFVPGWPRDKPLAMGWSHKTRMYPPGDLLLVAPIAALYHYTRLSFSGACRMLFGWFLVLAHVALFLFFLTYFEGDQSGVDWLACFLVYSQVIHWTLEGFYDPVVMAPMILCVRYLAQRRGLAAGVAYCVGALLHFRVFFQAPWALCAVWFMVREKIWQHLQPRAAAAMIVAGLCAYISLYVFWLDWGSLVTVPLNNPLRGDLGAMIKPRIWNFEVVLIACGAALLLARAWFDLVSMAFLGLIALSLREFYPWHFLISMSWIAAPAKRPMVRGVRLAFLFSTVAIAFGETFLPNWLWMLYHADPR
jgi:hypothetical protein